ncbi:MAG TPA: FAD-dependent oxidoreductase [Clostridia bacterium]|nr:FAD-dependent oxidoreductase [Clostridia bacterium]
MGKRVLIVGGVAGGATAAARLRRLDESAEIIIFERGNYISYANCGLPYYIGGVITDKDDLILQTPESFSRRFNIDVRVNSEVVKIDRSKREVQVVDHTNRTEYTSKYDFLILSPGAAPIVPHIKGADLERVFTLRTIPDTYKISDFIQNEHPRRAVIVGGGYIGMEMAENLHRRGLEVEIVELADHVIGPLDAEMAAAVHRHIVKNGVGLHLKVGVEEIENGLKVKLSNGETLLADMVILAVGIAPESKLARDCGLEIGASGGIKTDMRMKTSDERIYAVGDAVEVTDFVTSLPALIPLASPANKQGRIAAENISGRATEYKATQGSAVIKVFDMTVAITGANERALKRAGIPYEKVYTYGPSHASYYPDSKTMCIKTLFDKRNGRLLGAQITGYEGADKRCDVLATALRAGMTVSELTELELCYAPPYSSAKDPVNMAGYVADNVVKGDHKIFHWHDVASLDTRKVTLLDVRTSQEYRNGHIEGSINIELDALRDRMHEIEKEKPVYVLCEIGLRGYIACRILAQNGYDAYNLSGGYRLYNQLFPQKKKETVQEFTSEASPAQTRVIDSKDE